MRLKERAYKANKYPVILTIRYSDVEGSTMVLRSKGEFLDILKRRDISNCEVAYAKEINDQTYIEAVPARKNSYR